MGFKEQIDGVIDDYGTDIELIPITISYDDYGDETVVQGTPVVVKSIPYNYTYTQEVLKSMGMFLSADLYFIIKGDETVTADYVVSYDGKTFSIKNIEKYVLKGETLAQLLFVKEQDQV